MKQTGRDGEGGTGLQIRVDIMKTYHVWPAVLHETCLLTRLHISPWKSSQMPEFWDTEKKANMSGSDLLVAGYELPPSHHQININSNFLK